MEMVRNGTDNDVLNERLLRWVKALLTTTQARELPKVMVQELQNEFMVPQVAIKVWGVHPDFADEPYAQAVTESVKSLAQSLTQPFVGLRAHEEVLTWLSEDNVQSMALIPLHDVVSGQSEVIGLLVLTSPDAERYHDGMGTALLERLGELASAALTHLR
jgi:uncharacterized protein YigA (DUF484 family)